MRKLVVKRVFIFSLLEAILLLSVPALTIPSASATGLSMQYGALDTTPYDHYEFLNESAICGTIYNYYDWWGYDASPVNCYWYFTNASTVAYLLDLQSTGQYADWVTTWWVGDFHPSPEYPYPEPYGQMWFYGYPNGDTTDIQDNMVWTQTTNGGQQASYETFCFIWTCSNGGRYWTGPGEYDDINGITTSNIPDTEPEPTFTPSNTNTMYGFVDDEPPYTHVGMPFAWTGITNMRLDGYGSPGAPNYCYIGWEAPSPFIKNTLVDSPYSRKAGEFVERFYYNAIYNGYTANDALDAASYYCYGVDFDETPLYNGYWNKAFGKWWFSTLRVLGNGNMYAAQIIWRKIT